MMLFICFVLFLLFPTCNALANPGGESPPPHWRRGKGKKEGKTRKEGRKVGDKIGKEYNNKGRQMRKERKKE